MSEASGSFASPVAPPAAAPVVALLAGFWRRFLALILDGILLMLVGLALGAVFGGAFARLGPWGRLVGFGVALAYFVLLDGPLGGGRTPGKRALGIRVTDERGETPGWGAAVVRGSFLALCFALNGYMFFGGWRDPRFAAMIVFLAVVNVTLYLVIFERRRRQGVHDIAAGTFVARTGAAWSPPGARNPVHAAVLIGLFALGAFGGRLVWARFGALVQPLLDAQRLVADATGLDVIGIQRTTTYMKGSVTRSLTVSAMAYADPGEAALRDDLVRAAKAILSGNVSLDGLDALSINVMTGYNIGIAQSSSAHWASMPPDHWRAWLAGTGPGPFPLAAPAAPVVPAPPAAAASPAAPAAGAR